MPLGLLRALFPTTFLEISYKYGLIASEIAGKKSALPASSPINEK